MSSADTWWHTSESTLSRVMDWRHQVIAWTKFDLPSRKSTGIHPRVVFTWILKISSVCVRMWTFKTTATSNRGQVISWPILSSIKCIIHQSYPMTTNLIYQIHQPSLYPNLLTSFKSIIQPLVECPVLSVWIMNAGTDLQIRLSYKWCQNKVVIDHLDVCC